MYSSIAQANEAIIERIKAARPHWVAVRPAKEAVAELSSGRKLLHAVEQRVMRCRFALRLMLRQANRQ